MVRSSFRHWTIGTNLGDTTKHGDTFMPVWQVHEPILPKAVITPHRVLKQRQLLSRSPLEDIMSWERRWQPCARTKEYRSIIRRNLDKILDVAWQGWQCNGSPIMMPQIWNILKVVVWLYGKFFRTCCIQRSFAVVTRFFILDPQVH